MKPVFDPIVPEFVAAFQQHEYCDRWWSDEAILTVLKHRVNICSIIDDTSTAERKKFNFSVTIIGVTAALLR
jgi:hypothetical protein